MHGQYLHSFLWVLSRGGLFSLKSDLVEILRVLEVCEKIQESAAHSHMRQKQNRSAWMCLWLYSSFLPAWAAFTLVAVGLCSCVCAKITFRFYHVFVHVEWKRASPVNVKVHAFIPFLNWVSKETLCVTGLLPTPTAPLKAACQVSFTISTEPWMLKDLQFHLSSCLLQTCSWQPSWGRPFWRGTGSWSRGSSRCAPTTRNNCRRSR